MMNPCVKYEEWMSAYVDGALSDTEQAEFLAHLQTCPACSATWQDYELMSKALGETEFEPPETLVADVMAKIGAQPVLRVHQGGGFRRFIAVAAVFAVVAFVGGHMLGSPLPQEEAVLDYAHAADDELPSSAMLQMAENEPDVWYGVTSPITRTTVTAADEAEEEEDSEDTEIDMLAGEPAVELAPELILFDLFLSREISWDWNELSGRLLRGGYYYEMEHGFFYAPDPYRPGSYLYGMLVSDGSDTEQAQLKLLGYAYRTEGAYRRVELRSVDGTVSYYYAVPYASGTGMRADTREQLRAFLLFGHR